MARKAPGNAYRSGLESLLAMLRRGYHGGYYKIPPKHLNGYMPEFSGRYDVREMGAED